ncbi:hypothetical protein J2S78_002461 [Salibacterium salarium]|uniref:hypothetical protein n=1 Tax=Salibacterium salarium TaxID=284579 RepID=UPI002785426D|nr:hypothetical protein [Salibacterium salarium]MDQ0300014.1 hypothetical protein [Salibacterium salarium]
MKPVHVTKKLTKAQKKAYKPHALPEFSIHRTFPIEWENEDYYLVGQFTVDTYDDHFMHSIVLDKNGNKVDDEVAKSIHQAYTYWMWVKKALSLIPILEARLRMNPDEQRMEELIQRIAVDVARDYNPERAQAINVVIPMLKAKPLYESQILNRLYSLKRVVEKTESEKRLSEPNSNQIISLWETLQEEYKPWLQDLFALEEHASLSRHIERGKNFSAERDYVFNIILERNYLQSVVRVIGHLSESTSDDWKQQREWHFERTIAQPEDPKPDVSFKGKYKPYPVLKWIYNAFVYALIPLEALLFLFTWNIGILIIIGIQLLVFVPIIRIYRMWATLHLSFQWKEIIADKSKVLDSFEAKNLSVAPSYKLGGVYFAGIGAVMYFFTDVLAVPLTFFGIGALLYGYGQLAPKTSLVWTTVEFHEAWIKIGPNEFWGMQIRELVWEEENTLKIDLGKGKVPCWIQFKLEDKQTAEQALTEWCQINGCSVAG